MVLRMKNKQWIIPLTIGIIISTIIIVRGGIGGAAIMLSLIAFIMPIWFIIKYSELVENIAELTNKSWEKTILVIGLCCALSIMPLYLYNQYAAGQERELYNSVCKEAGYEGIWMTIPFNDTHINLHCCSQGQCVINKAIVITEKR